MALHRFQLNFALFLAFCLAGTRLMASEHHGLVRSNGLAIPGATITAAQGDQKHTTTTDENGAYSFRDLPDGVWTIQVDMLGFGRFTKEVGIAPNAPSPEWDLKPASMAEILAAAKPPAPAPSTAVPAPPAV